MKMEKEKGERCVRFLKIVFEDFFFSLRIFLLPLSGKSFIFESLERCAK